MKALVYTNSKTMEFQDVDDPSPAVGEALIRVKASGICGSDMHAWAGHDERRPSPLILGHEAAGEIVGFGGATRRVTVNPLVTCGTCEACTAGKDNLCSTRQIISMPPREGAFADPTQFSQFSIENGICCGFEISHCVGVSADERDFLKGHAAHVQSAFG